MPPTCHNPDPYPDPDAEARRTLHRHKAFATALLVLMAALTLGTYALPASTATDLLQAAAKAGFVGGIADWFAVTALFRHPLGIPIPHTAIIPNQKARLGAALGRFVATHVFTADEVAGVLTRLDLPGILHRFLADRNAARPTAIAFAAMLPRILSTVEDGRARRLVARIVPRILGGPGAGRVVARALHTLVEGGRHQEVFGFVLAQLRTLLASKEDALASRHRGTRPRTGRPPRRMGAGRLHRPPRLGHREHRTRQNAARTAPNCAPHSTNGSAGRSPGSRKIRPAPPNWAPRSARVVAHETVQAWLWDVWARLRMALEADAGKPTGHTVAYIEGALANLGAMLEADPAARARLHAAVQAVVASLLPTAQTRLSDFIAQVVANWDTNTIVERLELRVGKDLQYVRVNGTLVGFLVGGLLYWLLRATFGHVSF